jgi:hypothetical protein
VVVLRLLALLILSYSQLNSHESEWKFIEVISERAIE